MGDRPHRPPATEWLRGGVPVLAAVTRTGMALRRAAAGNTSWGEVGDSGDDGLCPVELNLVSTPARPAANNHRETTATYADNVALPAFTTLTCEMQRFFVRLKVCCVSFKC